MTWFWLLLVSFINPFWESKAPADWTDIEVQQLLNDSPWAQQVAAPGSLGGGSPVQVYLATAGPVAAAEQQRDLRAEKKRPAGKAPVEDLLAEEYRIWLEDNRAKQIVVAVKVGNNRSFSDEKEVQRIEKEAVMKVGGKKYNLTGHFPPSSSDPYLRLAFPRQVQASDKAVVFEMYLPGVAIPHRQVEFRVKDMIVDGKLEM